ncbi:MAG: C-GCAxxG-C-C family protein [Dehalococcoidia bacterium]|jgi:C_GCAxxG_C_C family probable redox protein
MSDVERAVDCFEEGFNCCQAVLSSYGPRFGLDRESALKIASGFGGGVGHLGESCGAVTGALMVIGLKGDASAPEATYRLVDRFLDKFKARQGSIFCRQLLGYDISTPQGLQAIKDRGLFDNLCPNFVRASAEILEDIL